MLPYTSVSRCGLSYSNYPDSILAIALMTPILAKNNTIELLTSLAGSPALSRLASAQLSYGMLRKRTSAVADI
ncbi:MAG: hypothetical protein AB4080_09725 [Trichodesmium sp.]